jgi:hypothetical protein
LVGLFGIARKIPLIVSNCASVFTRAAHPPVLSEQNVLEVEAIAAIALQGWPE